MPQLYKHAETQKGSYQNNMLVSPSSKPTVYTQVVEESRVYYYWATRYYIVTKVTTTTLSVATTSTFYTSTRAGGQGWLIVLGLVGVSIVPRPSRAPARKRVWNLSQDFLPLLSQHVRKTGNPIRTQDSKQSCDFNAYCNTAWFQFHSHWNRIVRPKHMTIVLNYVNTSSC